MVFTGWLIDGAVTGDPDLLSNTIRCEGPCDVAVSDLGRQVRIYQAFLEEKRSGVLYSHDKKVTVLFSFDSVYLFAFHLFMSPTAGQRLSSQTLLIEIVLGWFQTLSRR